LASAARCSPHRLYRLKVLTLALPPPRERGEALPLLARHFIESCARKYDRPVKRLTPAAEDALRACRWIGNVRELAHVIERAMLLVAGDPIEAAHLGLESHLPAEAGEVPAAEGGPLEAAERQLMRQALEASGWNVSDAARRLGVSREVLRYRMRKHGLVPPGR